MPKARLHIFEKVSNDPKEAPRKRIVSITADSVTLGSDSHSDIQLKGFDRPFTIEIKNDGNSWWLLNPMRHPRVKINGKPLSLEHKLSQNDQILIDGHRVLFENQSKRETLQPDFVRQPAGDDQLWDFLVAEDQFDEILINGAETIFVDFRGMLFQSPWKFSSEQFLINKIAESRGTDAGGWHSWRLNRSLRFQAALPPLVDVPHLAIRKAKKFALNFDALEEAKFGSPDQMAYLREAIKNHQNIIISGGTSTGKTVFLRSLVELIDPRERIVLLEEEAEIDWPHPHLVSVECGRGGLRQSIIESLRMRPNRLIVSEVRGVEAFEMLQAMNTGHSGCLTTIHSNSTREAVSRLESLILSSGAGLPLGAVRRHIAQAIHLIVQLSRNADGERFIESISRIGGIQNETILFADPLQTEPLGIKQKILKGD